MFYIATLSEVIVVIDFRLYMKKFINTAVTPSINLQVTICTAIVIRSAKDFATGSWRKHYEFAQSPEANGIFSNQANFLFY